jgi:hypothetical protein
LCVLIIIQLYLLKEMNVNPSSSSDLLQKKEDYVNMLQLEHYEFLEKRFKKK